MENQAKNNFYDFCKIIKMLRSPGGCPWDMEQTHQTLSKHLIEEAYEAFDAIEDGDPKKMADELGDVLLQVVMHAQIGAEEGTFDIDDVIEAVSKKMIERHPHIFGDVKVNSSGDVLDNWEKIKRKERGQKSVCESMEEITRSLPALTRSIKVIDKARKANLLNSIEEKAPLGEDEIGEKLFEICRVAEANGIDAETALSSYTKKFIKKLKNIEKNT